MATTSKADVLNPITLFNTVGQELEEILSVHTKDQVNFMIHMDWLGKNLAEVKKISNIDLKKIASFFNIDGLDNYLASFQADYKETETKSAGSFKENKKIFTQFKGMLPLLGEEFDSGIDVLADISDFFGIDDEREIIKKAGDVIALYRITGFPIENLNLYAWMRRGELDFQKLNLPNYDKSGFENWINSNEWKEQITAGAYFKSLPNIFWKYGVGLVFTPYLTKTVYGAVRWFDGKPLIQVSDREKSLAVCWYTLFHEIGHVLLHENDNIFEGEINEKKSKETKKEQEANAYANQRLYNGDGLRRYIFSQKHNSVQDAFISQVAQQFNTYEMFVAYWMKKAQIRSKFSNDYIPSIEFS